MIDTDKLFCFLLAGGEGSRLKSLTEKTCKPLIKIGSHYHLIDFTILNCLYSNVFNISIIVQYEAIDLIKYLFESNITDLGNIYILPPGTTFNNKDNILYQNTAHSVYLNKDIVKDKFEDILVLAADHVYSMNYSAFYEKHLQSGADLSVAYIDVPKEEASRFGIFNLDESGEIINFEEKPKNPKSTLASMGIYIFKKELLFNVLDKLVDEISLDLDFGDDIIPYFIQNHKVNLYPFEGYWKDLGTINSFWEINMAILDNPDMVLKLFNFDERFKIYQDTFNSFPPFFKKNSSVHSSIIGKKSFIDGEIIHSVIGFDVHIQKNTKIIDSVVMDGCIIKKGVTVKNAVISKDSIVEEDVIGEPDNIISI